MKHIWIQKKDTDKLLIFFGGFACDENLLKHYSFGDYSVLMFYDYRDLKIEVPSEAFEFSEVCHVAWSFGVWVADFVGASLPPAKTRIALCGSVYPVDDSSGIPEKIFCGTIDNFEEKTKEKFLSRVYGIRNLDESRRLLSPRSASEDKAELESLAAAFKTFESSPENWTRAIAALNDKIFPLENLRNAWGEKLEVVDGEHFPRKVFEHGLERLLTNTPAIARRFGRSFESYDKEADVQRKIARHLAKLAIKRIDADSVNSILEIGVGTGFLTKELSKKLKGKHWHLNDLSADAANYIKNIVDTIPVFIEGDAQLQEFPKGMDLIMSASCFQWIENLEHFFKKLADSSRMGTILAFSTFLPENLREIRSLTGKGLKYMGIVGLESIMTRNGFEILCSEAETIKLTFDTPTAVLRHLRETGVGGTFSEFWTPQKLKHFSKQYVDFFSNSAGGVSLTYRPIYFIAKYVGEVMEPEGE